MRPGETRRTGYDTVVAYGLAHAAVDAACAALLFRAVAAGLVPARGAFEAVLVYDILAFAGQPLVGWFVNHSDSGRCSAMAGAALTACALPISLLPTGLWPGVVVAGLGNALFHVGGGVVAIRLRRGGATMPALFVAPGAAGLAIGVALGAGRLLFWLPAVACAAAAVGLAAAALPTSADESRTVIEARRARPLGAAVLLVLAVVAMRSYIGTALPLPWKSEAWLLVTLTAAVVAGKALGGVFADRFGLRVVGVGALIASLPLLLAAASPVSGIVGMLLFNMTMPVTLVVMADLMPERPGFAFGLTCLALIVGAIPPLLHVGGSIEAPALVAGLAVSAALLWVAVENRASRVAPIPAVLVEQEAS